MRGVSDRNRRSIHNKRAGVKGPVLRKLKLHLSTAPVPIASARRSHESVEAGAAAHHHL